MSGSIESTPNSGRRQEILEAAFSVLAERGYSGASMIEIARRASASKETLYSWFGDKRGLFEELILSNAEKINETLASRVGELEGEPSKVLRSFGIELLRLLLGERAVIVNRMAISEANENSAFGRILISKGRENTLPRLSDYLEAQKAAGRLFFDNAYRAMDTLLGLLVTDLQIRRLLGVVPMPSDAEMEARAIRAVDQFMILFGSNTP
jgi:AcrR family transcriptional regulator